VALVRECNAVPAQKPPDVRAEVLVGRGNDCRDVSHDYLTSTIAAGNESVGTEPPLPS
jgi:hypothetical protein